MKTEKLQILKRLDDQLEELKTPLYQEFGDPGHDIGDADNIIDLLASLSEPWEKEDIDRAITIISETSDESIEDLMEIHTELLFMDYNDYRKLYQQI